MSSQKRYEAPYSSSDEECVKSKSKNYERDDSDQNLCNKKNSEDMRSSREYKKYSKSRKRSHSKVKQNHERSYHKSKRRRSASSDLSLTDEENQGNSSELGQNRSGEDKEYATAWRNRRSDYSSRNEVNNRNQECDYSSRSEVNNRNRESDYSSRNKVSDRNREDDYSSRDEVNARNRENYSSRNKVNDRNRDSDYCSRDEVNDQNRESDYSSRNKVKDRNRESDYSSRRKVNDRDKESDYSSRNKVNDRNRESDYSFRSEVNDRNRESDYYSSRNKVNDQNSDYSSSEEKRKRHGESSHRYELNERTQYKGASSEDVYTRRNDKKYDSRREETSYSTGSRDTNDIRTRAISSKVDRNEKNRISEPDGNVRSQENQDNDRDQVNKAPKKMISGAYIPPAKLKLMQQEITDKGSIAYQKISWEALKKSINGLTNKVNTSNIAEIVKELFKENIIRGRGVLARALMQAQALSPTFTHVYAALVAVLNTKFPEISELLLKRLILQFKRGFRRNDKQACLSSVRFIAHLLNQQVAHEVLVLEILTLLLENPTDHSVEVSIALLKECGKRLKELSSKGFDAIYSRLRHVLHEASIDKRTQYMIEVMCAIIKDKFKDYPSVQNELDLVEENDKFTHLITLDEAVDTEEMLNVFKFDPEYEANEERYKTLVKEILGDSDSEESDESEAEESDNEEENEAGNSQNQEILDMTETNLVALRRNIYLTIQSSLVYQECAHKLLKMQMKPGEIMEMCYMILDCCAQQRTYEKFYGLLAQRFCELNKVYVEAFMEIFRNSYDTIHRLATEKLRNVAKFFAHLLYTDAIHWNVLSTIRLNENDTTSSSRIFIKILFQELCEYMGLPLLDDRVKDTTLQEAFDGLFPRDNPHNTRFAINFFTSIGLGGLTDELREHLKTAPKYPVVPFISEVPPEASSSSSPADSSSSSAESSSSSSSSSDSEEDVRRRKKLKGSTSSQSKRKNSKRSRTSKENKISSGDKKKKGKIHRQ